MSRIKDITLAPSGADKIAWVQSYMPILNTVKAEFEKTRPFAGMRISMSIHLVDLSVSPVYMSVVRLFKLYCGRKYGYSIIFVF